MHPDYDGSRPEDDSHVSRDRTKGLSHGTCMVSRVAGNLHGLAKKANVIVVRVPRRDGHDTRSATNEDYLEGVAKVTDDVVARRKLRAVLNMSWIYYRFSEGRPSFPKPENPMEDDSDGFRIRLRMMLRYLISIGVVPVTGSGNSGLVIFG